MLGKIKRKNRICFRLLSSILIIQLLTSPLSWSQSHTNIQTETLSPQSVFKPLVDEGILETAENIFSLLAGIRLLQACKTLTTVNSILKATYDGQDGERQLTFLSIQRPDENTDEPDPVIATFSYSGKEDVMFEIKYWDTAINDSYNKNVKEAGLDEDTEDNAIIDRLTYTNVFQEKDRVIIRKLEPGEPSSPTARDKSPPDESPDSPASPGQDGDPSDLITGDPIATARTAFSNPQAYRDLLINNKRVRIAPKKGFNGKALACLFLTRFCPVGCKHCFFSSPVPESGKTQADAFTPEGAQKLTDFLNDANMGVILVSGGGDPFIEMDTVRKLVEEVNTDHLYLMSSAYWGKTPAAARRVVDQLYESMLIRRKNGVRGRVILRISVDKGHADEIGLDGIKNVIDIFNEKFANETDFALEIHSMMTDPGTMEKDPTIDNMLAGLPYNVERSPVKDASIDTYREEAKNGGKGVIKVSPRKEVVTLTESGLSILIGYAKLFHSDMKVDLHDEETVARNAAVFTKDMRDSEGNNTAVAFNAEGEDGLDFLVSYDGTPSLWGAHMPDNPFSLYSQDYDDIVDSAFQDVITLSYLEKGIPYREAIINEVNPVAVTRMKAINIRDFAGSYLYEESKTRLYLTVRILQDYIAEGRISADVLPPAIQQLVSLDKDTLIRSYHESDYSIITQYIESPYVTVDEQVDLYELVTLGHYDVTPEQMIGTMERDDVLTSEQRAEFFVKMTKLSMPILSQDNHVKNPNLEQALEWVDEEFMYYLERDFEYRDVILEAYKIVCRNEILDEFLDGITRTQLQIAKQKGLREKTQRMIATVLKRTGYTPSAPYRRAEETADVLAGSPNNFFNLLIENGGSVSRKALMRQSKMSRHTVESDMRILRKAGLVMRQNENARGENDDAAVSYTIDRELITRRIPLVTARQILNNEFKPGMVTYKSRNLSEKERIIAKIINAIWHTKNDTYVLVSSVGSVGEYINGFGKTGNIRQFVDWVTSGNITAATHYIDRALREYTGGRKKAIKIFTDQYLPYLLTYTAAADIMALRSSLYESAESKELGVLIATDKQYELETSLSSRDEATRRAALKTLGIMLEDGDIICAPQNDEGNPHQHTKFSRAPYYPEQLAYWARRAGLRSIGIIDHDTARGVAPFKEALEVVGQTGVSGIELRTSLTNTPVANRVFNASDVPNVTYFIAHGFPNPDRPGSKIRRMLEEIREAKEKRFREIVRRINAVLDELGIEVILDYDTDIMSISEEGNPVDRHITEALAKKINKKFDGEVRESTYALIMDKETLTDKEKKAIHSVKSALNVLRKALLKPNKKYSCIIQPNELECPRIEGVIQAVKEEGGIPLYSYPDATEVTREEEEQALRALFPVLKKLGVLGVQIMTNRSSEEEIRFVMGLAAEYGLMLFGYKDKTPLVDINAPSATYPEFKKGNDFLLGHEILQRYTGYGFYSPEIIDLVPEDSDRFDALAAIGALDAAEQKKIEKKARRYDKLDVVKDLLAEVTGAAEKQTDLEILPIPEERRLSREFRDNRGLLDTAAQYITERYVNMRVDLTPIPREGLTDEQHHQQLEENMTTLARTIAWHNTFGFNIHYILQHDDESYDTVNAEKILTAKLNDLRIFSGINVDELISRVGSAYPEKDASGEQTLEVWLRGREGIEQDRIEHKEIPDWAYPVALDRAEDLPGEALPNYSAASSIGLALAAFNIVAEETDKSGTIYEDVRNEIMETLHNIYLAYNLITSEDEFKEEDLINLVQAQSEIRYDYVIQYALPPIIKQDLEMLRKYHEKIQDILQAA